MGLEFLTLHQQSVDHGSGVPGLGSDISDLGDRKKSNIRLAVALIFFLFYLAIGAAIFSAIEAPQEDKAAKTLRTYLASFKADHECISPKELENLMAKVIEAAQKGILATRNVTFDNNWGFGQAFFFSGTLVTTVGYGHVSPVSQPGKAFTIIYCIIGIPMFLILLTGFVERLKYPSIWFMGKLNSRMGHLYRPSQIQLVHLCVLFSLLVVFMFLVPALIFMGLEKSWTFLDAFYYCFISLTTIGLGDYIPGDQADQTNRAVYKIFTTGYLMIGILCMMLFLAAVYDIPMFSVSYLFLLPNPASAERSRLADRNAPGPKYVRQLDDADSHVSPSSTVSQVATEDSYQYH